MGIQELHGIPSTDALIQELHGILSTYPGLHWISSTDPSTLVLYWIPITSTRIASYPQHWSMNYTGTPAFASRTERDYQHWYFWFLWVELNSLLSQLWHPLRNLRNSTGSTLNNLAGRQLRSRNIIHTVSFFYYCIVLTSFIHSFIYLYFLSIVSRDHYIQIMTAKSPCSVFA